MKKKHKFDVYKWPNKLIGRYLAENKDRAEAIIEAAFPGMHLKKYRKDRGIKKLRPTMVNAPPYETKGE